MHAECYRFVERVANLLGAQDSVLEIGSRNVNGSVRPLFPSAEYTGIDYRSGPGVDIVANAEAYRPSCLVDLVVCTEVLEHACNADAICQTAYEALKPGGVLILTAAGRGRAAHGTDGGQLDNGEWYANIDEGHLRSWLKQFGTVLIEVDDVVCDVRALAIK